MIIICLYVHDLCIIGSNEDYIGEIRSYIMKEFKMTNLSNITYLVGIEFQKDSKWMVMHQKRHALEILKKFEIEQCNVAIKLVEPRLQLSKDDGKEEVYPTQYKRLNG